MNRSIMLQCKEYYLESNDIIWLVGWLVGFQAYQPLMDLALNDI